MSQIFSFLVLFSCFLCSTTLQHSGNFKVTRATGQERVLDPIFKTDGQGLGQVSGIDLDSKGDIFVFHRANRLWTSTSGTFQRVGNLLSLAAREPITENTIFKLDPNTGRKISSFGGNIFNVPHGLTVDKDDNVWVTDAGRHQILRFPKNATQADLELGEKFVPGSDTSHFCKPADVAVASTGEFFVADGYCNSRIIKFSSDAQVLAQWGTSPGRSGLTPFTLNIVHSITLIEDLDLVCVADRENSRALCYNAGLKNVKSTGIFNRTIVRQGEIGKVYAVHYNKADKTVLAAGLISRVPYLNSRRMTYPPRAFTYTTDGLKIESWAYMTQDIAKLDPSLIHDLCSSSDGSDVFLADQDQHRILKYTKS